jgi:DNA repair exonuclease SbcCD nuclease subunit
MKLVHAADLHIDSPLRGLSRYEGAPADQIRGATRRAFENLCELCVQEQASVLLIAGDVFDGDWRDYSTGLFFAAQMARLREAGVRVVMLRGNHDAKSQISRELRLPDNVRELSTRRPETIVLEDLGIAVHGQGFAAREVPEDLAAKYPAPIASVFNVGLLHTSLNGREGHEPYAPTSADVLRGKGYDYWALGHVHAREVVATDPYVVFPGNLQGRHARETGPKGASVLSVEHGRVTELRHEPLDVVRWAVCEVDAGLAADAHEVVERARTELARHAAQAGGRLLAARVVISGKSRAHAALARDPEHWTEQLRAASLDVGEGSVWLEKVQLATSGPLDPVRLAQSEDAIGQLARALGEQAQVPSALLDLASELAELKRKLPREAFEGEDALKLDDPAFLARVVEEVRELVLGRLLDTEGA